MAFAISTAFGKRSAGDFDSAVATTASSSPKSIFGSTDAIVGGFSIRCLRTTWIGSSAMNGLRPVSISNSITPHA